MSNWTYSYRNESSEREKDRKRDMDAFALLIMFGVLALLIGVIIQPVEIQGAIHGAGTIILPTENGTVEINYADMSFGIKAPLVMFLGGGL